MSEPRPEKLAIKLLTDTTFGSDKGLAGEVDTDVEHDIYGIPYVGGKTLRGLLRDTWLSMGPYFEDLHQAGERVFGPSQRFDDLCVLRIGDGLLCDDVRPWLVAAATRDNDQALSADTILAGCTDIRYQSAEDRSTGAPEQRMLRATRVIVRELQFEARLDWLGGEPQSEECRVLAMVALATRHGGLLRNRGRGHLRITLDGDLDRTRQLAGVTNTEGVS